MRLGRSAFALADAVTGDRGLARSWSSTPSSCTRSSWPALQATPTSTPGRIWSRRLEAAWAARVEANNAQVDRHREVPDGTDFYAPVTGLFRADPTRTDEPSSRSC